MIEIISRFNNGNGGVSIVISQETGRFGMGGVEEIKEMGEFLYREKAVDLAIEIIEKATNKNMDEDTKSRIMGMVNPGRLVIR